MIPRDLFFASQDEIWNILWIVFFGALILYSAYLRAEKRTYLVSPTLSPWVISGRDPYLTGFRYFAFFLGWILAVVALMQPLGNETYPKMAQGIIRESKAPIEIYLLIDVSQSMAVNDMGSGESRLKKAIDIADALVKDLRFDPSALYAYTSQATSVVPLTYDGVFVRLMLRELTLNYGDSTGTLIGNALLELKKEALSQYPKAPKAVILLSDGGDNLAEQNQNEKNELMKTAYSLKVPIFTVGIGSLKGGVIPGVLQQGQQVSSSLEEGILKGIAEASGGRYWNASEFSSADIAAMIVQSLEPFRLRASSEGLLKFADADYKHYFQVPLGLAMALFLIFAFLPYGKKLLPLFLISSLWSQDTGESLYDAGHYQEAADWYSGELKSLPTVWLRDKLFYDLGVSEAAKEAWGDATDSFFMVSQEAYSYPLFRLRLVYSRLLALLEQAKKEKRPELLQEGLWMFQILEDLPKDLKLAFQMELGKALEEVNENKGSLLDSLIRIVQFTASLPELSPDFMPALRVIFQNGSEFFGQFAEYKRAEELISQKAFWEALFSLIQLKENLAKEPKDFLQSAIESLMNDSQETIVKDASRFYSLVYEWQKKQFEKGLCQCDPWKEAIPLFTEGFQMQRARLSEAQMPYTYSKWSEALRLLKDPSPGGKSQEENKDNQQLQELQQMQNLDKQFQKPQKQNEGEGMKW